MLLDVPRRARPYVSPSPSLPRTAWWRRQPARVARFAEEVGQLGGKLAILLVQLPPKLAFDAEMVERFFANLQKAIKADLVCDPRNAGWFNDDADALLGKLGVARVAADPVLSPAAGSPGGWRGLPYWRLHGSPNIYRSAYGDDAIASYAAHIQSRKATA